MNFLAQAKLTEDTYLIDRVAACAASQGMREARLWAVNHMWALSAQPDWSTAYGKVLDGETITDPAAWAGTAGADPTVITDEMILAGVTAVLADEQQASETEAAAAADRTAQLEESLRQTQTQVQLLTEQIAPTPSE